MLPSHGACSICCWCRRFPNGRIEHVRQVLGEGDGHVVAHALRQLDEVGFVVLGQHHVAQAGAVGGQYLLLDAADRQHNPERVSSPVMARLSRTHLPL